MKITEINMPMPRGGQATGECEVNGERLYFTCTGVAHGTYRTYQLTEEEWGLINGEPLPNSADDWARVMKLATGIHDRTPEGQYKHEDIDWSVVPDPVRYVGPDGVFRRSGDVYVLEED